MSCCGSRRTAAQSRSTGLRRAPVQPAPPPAPPTGGVALVYSGPVPMHLPSPSGGAPYRLTSARQRLVVAAADAAALRNTGWFVLAAG